MMTEKQKLARQKTESELHDFNMSSTSDLDKTLSLASGIEREKKSSSQRRMELMTERQKLAQQKTDSELHDFNLSSTSDREKILSLASGIQREPKSSGQRRMDMITEKNKLAQQKTENQLHDFNLSSTSDRDKVLSLASGIERETKSSGQRRMDTMTEKKKNCTTKNRK